jgi:hypothetical protein
VPSGLAASVSVRGHLLPSVLSTASMALASGIPRLHSLCLPIATAGSTMGPVPHLTMGRGHFAVVAGLALVRGQTVAATVHRCDTSDNEDNGEETEDQDVEHGPLDHVPPGMFCSRCCAAAPPTGNHGLGVGSPSGRVNVARTGEVLQGG